MQKTLRIVAVAFLLSIGCANSVSAFSIGVVPTCSTCTKPVGTSGSQGK